jgi:hypothetical protein
MDRFALITALALTLHPYYSVEASNHLFLLVLVLAFFHRHRLLILSSGTLVVPEARASCMTALHTTRGRSGLAVVMVATALTSLRHTGDQSLTIICCLNAALPFLDLGESLADTFQDFGLVLLKLTPVTLLLISVVVHHASATTSGRRAAERRGASAALAPGDSRR